MNTDNRSEIAAIPVVVRCTECGTLHFEKRGSCPQCSAPNYRQTCMRDATGGQLQTHANAARAFGAQALRLLHQSENAAAQAVTHTALARAKGEVL
jgi:hypothetical protein